MLTKLIHLPAIVATTDPRTLLLVTVIVSCQQ